MNPRREVRSKGLEPPQTQLRRLVLYPLSYERAPGFERAGDPAPDF